MDWNMFLFSSLPWRNNPIWTSIFFKWLGEKPPTREVCHPNYSCFFGAHLVASKLGLARGNGWNHLMRSTFWRMGRDHAAIGVVLRKPQHTRGTYYHLFFRRKFVHIYILVYPGNMFQGSFGIFLEWWVFCSSEKIRQTLFFRPWVGMW